MRSYLGLGLLALSAFLVATPVQGQQGVGVGVKGGWLYSSFSEANSDFDNNSGWAAGIFFGGNRDGVVGVQGEVLYAKKGAKEGQSSVDLHYLEIPILARLNLGSSNRNTGALLYAIGGPVFDVRLKAEQDSFNVKDNYESTDVGVIAGAGVEISRFLIEARYNWGLRNILKSGGGANTELKNRSFAILAGLRFN
jgi:hypothetical protein